MKTLNTVNLDLEEYNELRDFRDTILNGGAIIREIDSIYCKWVQKCYTKDEAIEMYANKIKKLDEIIEKNKTLYEGVDFKTMTWRQFKRFKRRLNRN